jgi:hypothetical protein
MNPQLLNAQVTHDVCCVLYDQDTGQIAFVHRVTTIGQAPLPTEYEIEEEARANMKRSLELFGEQLPAALLGERPTADLSALMVSPDVFLPGRHYAVDSGAGKVIEGERPKAQTTPE